MEDVGARIGDEERVGARGAGGARDRAEVPRTLDRDGERDERVRRQVERLERRRWTAEHGKEAVGTPFRQAYERLRAELDDRGAAQLGCGDEVGVATG